jgi:hypothetical protein
MIIHADFKRVLSKTLAAVGILLATGEGLTLTAQTASGGIRGRIVVAIADGRLVAGGPVVRGSQQIPVPEFEVYLAALPGNTRVASVKTDPLGSFSFDRQPAGQYNVCWNGAGWAVGCTTSPITLAQKRASVPAIVVRPMVQKESGQAGAFWGRVQLADQSAAGFAHPHFGVNVKPKIAVTNAAGKVVASPVANAQGYFVAVNVPVRASRITVSLEAASATATIPADIISSGGNKSLVIHNSRPRILTVVAKSGGKVVQYAQPGQKLTVVAEGRDPDKDPLQYTWKADATSRVASLQTSQVLWTLAPHKGRQTLYVLAKDGKGGYASGRVSVSVGENTQLFGGFVADLASSPIAGASVNVNGQTFPVNAKGMFQAKVPVAAQYILRASAPGYVPASRTVDHNDAYQRFDLVHASVTTIDPTADATIVANRDAAPGSTAVKPATILVRAGSLVDDQGNTAKGPLQAHAATLDVSRDELPRDQSPTAAGAPVKALAARGAVFTEFVDAAGKRYHLAPGKTARITLPVTDASVDPKVVAELKPLAAAKSAAASPQDVLWTYDEQKAKWGAAPASVAAKQPGSNGVAKFDSSARQYVVEAPRFSHLKVGRPLVAASCIRILTQNIRMDAGAQAVVTFRDSGAMLVTQTVALNSALTQATNIALPPDRASLVNITVVTKGGVAAPNIQILDENLHVAAGNDINPTQTVPVSTFPFSDCYTATVQSTDQYFDGVWEAKFGGYFTNTEDQAISYYQGLDSAMTFTAGTWSGGNHATLGDFWKLGGFDSNGNGMYQTSHLDYGNLGFGEQVNMTWSEASGQVFSYVRMYGEPDQSVLNGILALIGNPDNAGFSVAMESAVLNVDGSPPIYRAVKYWVYDGGNSDAKLINTVDVDGYGPRAVPGVCQTCHGGDGFYPAPAPAKPTALQLLLRAKMGDVGASFQAFDFNAIRMASIFGLVPVPKDYFQVYWDLNHTVVDQTIANATIYKLVHGWYDGRAVTDGPNLAYVPDPEWFGGDTGKRDFYVNAFSLSCRSCHSAIGPSSNSNWASFDDVPASEVEANACFGKDMPNSAITNRNFWLSTSPHQPDVVANYLIKTGSPPGTTCQ